MQLIDKEAVLETLKPMIQIAETIEDEGLRKFVLGGFTNARNKISSLPTYNQ